MSILENDLTQEQKIDKLKSKIVKRSSNLYNRIQREHERIFNMIWKDEEATPQEILDEYGTSAIDLFTFSSSLQILLGEVDNTYVPLVPPKEYQIQEDGRVTVSEDVS